MNYPPSIDALIEALKGMPGVGGRSAEKLALWFLSHKKRNPIDLAEALVNSTTQIQLCELCGFFQEKEETCSACRESEKHPHTICVVEKASDVLSMSRSNTLKSGYHVLGGKLSPLDNITPEDLNIESLIKRVKGLVSENQPIEVILALGADIEAQATAQFIANRLTKLSSLCSVTQLAQGLAAGTSLSHADGLTLKHAFDGRKKIS